MKGIWGSLLGGVIGTLTYCLLSTTPTHALAIPPAPSLAVPIVDQTKTLSDQDIQRLASQIAASRQEKSYQIGILMISTLGNDEYLEGYSIKVARQWGIGEKSSSNGVLIVVVKDDRKMRIEVGDGLQGDLTDARASRIVRGVMAPAFKQQDFAGGLSGAITSIQKAVSKQADPTLAASSSSAPSNWWDLLVIALIFGAFIFSWVGSMLARSKSWWAGGVIGLMIGVALLVMFSWAMWAFVVALGVTLGGFLFDYLVSKNYASHKENGTLPSWWAGGGSIGGGGWSSGGGGGFGGGGFSGGGSSGSW